MAEYASGRAVLVRDAVVLVSLVVAGVVLVAIDDREHGGMLFAGALGMLAQARANRAAGLVRALPLVAGVGAAAALSGCTGDGPAAAGVVIVALGAAAIGASVLAGFVARALGRLAPLAFGLVVAASLGGCGGAQLATVAGVARTAAVVTCGVAQRLSDACERAGLSPERACPLMIEIELGGEVPEGAPALPAAPAVPAEGERDRGGESARVLLERGRARVATVDRWSAKRFTRAEWSRLRGVA